MVDKHLAGLYDGVFARKEVGKAIAALAIGLAHIYAALEVADPNASATVGQYVANLAFRQRLGVVGLVL